MKNMFFVLMTVILLLSTSTFAQSTEKARFGLGWYSTSAPVGGRLWFNKWVGADLGLGYANSNLTGDDKDRFHVNFGIVLNTFRTNGVNFFIRPGVELQTNSRISDNDPASKLIITADLGAEWFVTDRFSLSVGHGLQFEQLDDDGNDSNWGVSALRALSFNNVGFHFYF